MSIKKINGYKILLDHELGEGSYGKVYKGQQDGTGKQCAIKIITKKKIGSDPYLKSALFSEIQIMAKLDSPNIVGFYDVLESSHNYYIVQELCTGDLEKALKSQPSKKFSQEKAIQILFQLCNGFLTLVKEGIIHRDLKPANILINKGVVKIGDFGFAKQNIHKRVKNESAVGTPLYMSIQLLKGRKYTSKADIWALGCVFYELIHGATPFEGRTQCDIVSKMEKQSFHIDPKISNVTKDFLIKALKVYQQDRICWDDVFKHPIFRGAFNKYLNENQNLQNKYKKVMADLRFKINSDNIDLKKLWGSLGYEQEKDLSYQQFQYFLQTINPQISENQQAYFFQKMDANGDGSISLKQLEQELKKYAINLTSRYGNKIPFQVRKTNSISENSEQLIQNVSNKTLKWDEQFEKKVRNCFIKLNRIIQGKKLTLYKTFIAYDSDNTGVLTMAQFSKILKKLDSSFTPDQIQSVFDLVDQDNSQTIEFSQLNSYYCKVNCIPINMYLPKELKENKNKGRKDVPKRKTAI